MTRSALKATTGSPLQVMVVGSGKLATELHADLKSPAIQSVVAWSQRGTDWQGSRLVVHAGSGREMHEVVEFCQEGSITLIDLSTNGCLDAIEPDFPAISCPNTNLLMLKFMAMLRVSGPSFSGYSKSIVESHQQAKKTEPGTAFAMAASLDVPRDMVLSVRDPVVQSRDFGIAPEHLLRHAFHRITISDGPVSLHLETRVVGQAPYAPGLAQIIEGLVGRDLPPGKHEILELVEQGWF